MAFKDGRISDPEVEIKHYVHTFTIYGGSSGKTWGEYLSALAQEIESLLSDLFANAPVGTLVEIIAMTGFSNLISGYLYGAAGSVGIVGNIESFNSSARYSQLFAIRRTDPIYLNETFAGQQCNLENGTSLQVLAPNNNRTVSVYYRIYKHNED